MPKLASPTSLTTTPEGHILLLEQYDALTAAIQSALQKFAPGREVDCAVSLEEAEELAAHRAPALCLIDFDPPFNGLTPFLLRMRKANPEARVLIIGPGVTAELASEFRSLGALQFIEKPYDLSAFGAAVQALLGPWHDLESARSRGCLEYVSLADVVLAQCAGARTVELVIEAGAKMSGRIHLVDGQVVHAIAGKRQDGAALTEIFAWENFRVEEVERRSRARRTIGRDWSEVFLAATREAQIQRKPPPPPKAPPAATKPVPKIGKKIVLVDDTDMLLIFVEDTLTMADPQLQIATAPDGMSGVERITQVRPDLVLLDYSLPDINGDEVCARLLKNEATADIPILMMSGHVPEMARTAERYHNVVGTIAKPFVSEALVDLVQKTLRAGLKPVARKIPPPAPAPKPKPIPDLVKEPAPELREPEPPPSPPAPAPAPPRIHAPPIPEEVKAPPPPPEVRAPMAMRPPPVPIVSPPPAPAPVAPAPTPQPPVRAEVPTALAVPVVAKGAHEVVLGLNLQVVSMQLTPSLRMGAIRAKPSSFTVSVHASAAARAALPNETAFELAAVHLDARQKIVAVRLLPTQTPIQRVVPQNALRIGGLALIPGESREQLQLTPAADAPMSMHLLAHFELSGVELSPNFQLQAVVLRARSQTVQVTLGPAAAGAEPSGTLCETAGVRLDSLGRVAELLLNPLK